MKHYTAGLACVLLLAVSIMAEGCTDNGKAEPTATATPSRTATPTPAADRTRLDLEEYFQQVEAADVEFAERFEDLDINVEFAPAFDASQAVDNVSARAGIWRAFAEALDGIDPPAQIKERHDEWREAAANYAGGIDGLAEQLAGAKSFEEFTEVLELTGPDLNAAEDRVDDACAAVQAIGDDNGIEVNLQC